MAWSAKSSTALATSNKSDKLSPDKQTATQLEKQFVLQTAAGALDATWTLPAGPTIAQYLLAHGAGAHHRHHNMQQIAQAFARRGILSLRFNFPFMQNGKRRVDSQAVAVAVIVEAAAAMLEQHPALPLVVGGHSFGGRMASHAVAAGEVNCQAMVFCSFPLHPARKPSVDRAAHLPDIRQPMLFLSGTRDDLAAAELLEQVVAGLPAATLHRLDTANHSYAVLKRTRQLPVDVFTEMAEEAYGFLQRVF
ncbi:MAG: alpha/beta fold hydrolase [Pseudomonadota bacterium]